MMGNTATIVAQKVSAAVVFWIQMMISGAMATIGVTCNNTAYGNRLASIQRLCTNRKASSTPIKVAAARARPVILSVNHKDCASKAQSAARACAMSVGAGTR